MSSDKSWVKEVRALPLKGTDLPEKVKQEYIDQNLNNSRKLIRNLNEIGKVSDEYTANLSNKVDSVHKIDKVVEVMGWLVE